MQHQPNQGQRYQIATLHKIGLANGFIASQLDVHKSTIGRELKRNGSSKGNYNAANAQLYANDRKADKKHYSAFTNEMKTFINQKVQDQQWSPEQISGWYKVNNRPMVSPETIYRYYLCQYENRRQSLYPPAYPAQTKENAYTSKRQQEIDS